MTPSRLVRSKTLINMEKVSQCHVWLGHGVTQVTYSMCGAVCSHAKSNFEANVAYSALYKSFSIVL